MNYLSAKQLSEKWNISVRRVQQYCIEGKLSDVKKVGNAWLIPENVKMVKHGEEMNYVDFLFVGDTIATNDISLESAIDLISDKKKRYIFACEMQFLQGNCEWVDHLYHEIDTNDPLRINVLFLCCFGAITNGYFDLVVEIMEELDALGEKNISETSKSTLDIARKTLYLCFGVNLNGEDFFHLEQLPPHIRKAAILMQSYHYVNIGNYERAIGLLEGALVANDTISPRDIYFYLQCAYAFYKQKDIRKVKQYIDKALDIALANHFILPLADFYGLLSPYLEKAIRAKQPQVYKEIKDVCERTWRNYLILENYYANERITTLLTLKEFQVATLIVEGYSNREIAQLLDYSLETIKDRIRRIFTKLEISKRKELGSFIPIEHHRK